jgi:hypothetical protein
MDEKFLAFLVEIVKAGSAWSKNVIWLETYHVMKETSELIHFTLNLNVWTRVLLEEAIVIVDLGLERV